jgi:hypothetical protein
MNVRFEGDCVAKLDETQRPDNNRIGTKAFLNQYWALPPDLESMLLTWARKIVLQQYRGVKRTPLISTLMSACPHHEHNTVGRDRTRAMNSGQTGTLTWFVG